MKRKQFPAQIGPYAIKVKSEQSTDSWQDFDSVRLQISVGQDYHEGDKFIAAVEWAKPRFQKIIICLNDSLQRFNLMFETGLAEDKAFAIASSNGQNWLDRHSGILQSASHIEIKRWHEWLEDRNFEQTQQQVQYLYQNNDAFHQAIEANINAIWQRRQALTVDAYSQDNFSLFAQLSRRYLLEEISVFSMMFERGRAIDAYPGTTIFAALVFKGRNVEGGPPGLGKGHFCRIDFSRNKEEALKMRMA